MIRIKNLNYKNLLKDINLEIKEGEYVSLVGSNGSGKTTLAMLISKLLTDFNYEKIDIEKSAAMVFENPDNQIIGTTVEDDIAFGLQNLDLTREEIILKIDKVLADLEISNLKKRDITSLSGGQKQKLAFASLIALDYDFYILDEVTSMLDPESKNMILNLIKKLHDSGKTIIQITHFLEEVELTDRTIIINDGQISFDGQTKELLSNKEMLEKNRLI